MKDLLLVLVVATSVGISTAQTQNLLPCARAYYKEICSVEGGIPSWIRDQLDVILECNGPQTAEYAAGLASICAKDTEIDVYCGVAQYYVPDILQILTTDCADAIADESVNCPLRCTKSLEALRSSLGCCINTIFNITGPDQFNQIEVAFDYSLWSRCNVEIVNSTCSGPIILYEVMDDISPSCTFFEQANRVADAFCVDEESKYRDAVVAAQGKICEDFDQYHDNYCTQDGNGRYCLTRDGADDLENYLNPIRQNCRSEDSCSSKCKQSLEEFQKDLDCCLNVVYNSTAQILGLDTFPFEDDNLFQLCGLDSPDPTCDGSGSQALGAYGFTLLLVLFMTLLG